MDPATVGQVDSGIMNENVYINQPLSKKQKRAPRSMPQMDLNAPGLFTIVPQGDKTRPDGGAAKAKKKLPPLPIPRKPVFQLPPNVTVYPAHMMAPPLAPGPLPLATLQPGRGVPLAQPLFSYTGGQELLPAPTFAPLIDMKIRKLQHLATMRELDIEESSVLKALLHLQKHRMMKAIDFMKLVLSEAQAREDKPKRMLHRLERAGVRDGHVSIIALVKRRDIYYVCSALDGIPSEGISAVLRMLPGEGISKPRRESNAPEERVDAVLPKPEDFDKLVRFMVTPIATAEARRKCLLAFMCHCYGGKTLHAAGYIHACNQVISAEKGTTLARKFQKAQRIDELFSRKPGQGMKRKTGDGEAAQGAAQAFGDYGPGLMSLPAPQEMMVPQPVHVPQKRAKVGSRKQTTKKATTALPLESQLLRVASADEQQAPVMLHDTGYESDVLIVQQKDKQDKEGLGGHAVD